MFRRSVCSLLLLTLVSSVAVESAQAESSPTTSRTHSSHARQSKASRDCSRRNAYQSRNRVKTSRCFGTRPASHKARVAMPRLRQNSISRSNAYSPPPMALPGPPKLPEGMKHRSNRQKCGKRDLRAARQDGAKNHKQQTCSGNKNRGGSASHNKPRSYWATYLTTAYCQSGLTASGSYTSYGTVAATLPFGTRLFIPGYGNGTVLDRGGAVGPGHVDLFIPDCGQAMNWGTRTENIQIFY
jgi:3D (Asp-Asp-Asp) domain-containing protein